MKKALLSLVLFASITSQAQMVYKIDINEYSRNNMDEVLEPGFTPWKFPKDVNEATLEVDGVTFTMKTDGNMRGGWNKALVQAGEFNIRLTGDGVNLDPNECGAISLVIKGLVPGTHSIQTVHNSWKDPSTYAVWPITVALNGEIVHQSVQRTTFVTSLQEATVLTTFFTVSSIEDEVQLNFSTSEDAPPANMAERQNYDKTPILNGFMIDAVNSLAQAKRPDPADHDMHVDADEGSYLITWSAANDKVVKHLFYFGTDSTAVADAASPIYEGTDTTYQASNLRNLDTYYWRVDEQTADGTITRGEPWYFRPRHLAFPGAEGYGRYANGGRGGIVYHVTNLLDDGQPGSFRYGMEKLKGKRTIVFDVSGIIPLRGTLRAGDDCATIAGQTAPGKGICFRGAAMGFGDDQIVRFIRNRVGSGPTSDGMGFRSAREAIMDHCSISWSIDEGFSSREAGNITLQRTLISEALNIADHDDYAQGSAHGFAAVFGGDIGSFHHNLLANNSGRNPRLDGGMDGNGYYMGRLDIFNNVVYNWNAHPAYGESHEANFHRNYYKMGPATTRKWILRADVNQRGSNKGTESYYYMYNVLVDKTGKIIFDGTKHGDGSNTNTDGGLWQLVNEMAVDWNPWVDEPFYPSYATVESAYDAYKTVLSDVGCTQPVFDDHDQRQIQETLSGTAHYKGSISGLSGIPDTEEDVGGYETYEEVSRPANWDTDQDGMPDWWEKVRGSDANTADNNDDPDQDGYTLLEDYLNWMAEPHYIINTDAQLSINLKTLFAGFTNSPSFQSICVSGTASASIADGVLTIKTGSEGLTAFDVTVTDGEGTKMTRRVNIAATDVETTGITTVRSKELPKDHAIYTLDGHRVKTPVKGVNIVNGKKVLKK